MEKQLYGRMEAYDNEHQLETRKPCVVFRISGTFMYVIMLSMPLCAAIIAIGLSMIKDFQASTATACRVCESLNLDTNIV